MCRSSIRPGRSVSDCERSQHSVVISLQTSPRPGDRSLGAWLVVEASDKAYLAVPVVDSPLPLRALYFLGRNQGRAIDLGPSESLASLLLGGFLSYPDCPSTSFATSKSALGSPRPCPRTR
jgi:hypothetical protein